MATLKIGWEHYFSLKTETVALVPMFLPNELENINDILTYVPCSSTLGIC